MALFGRRTAVIPLGISCQTAFQIERGARRIAELTGEIFIPETTPFDWRIVGPADIEEMIERNDFFPKTAAELEGTKRPYWRKHRCHFWHDPAGHFPTFVAKQEHLWANWLKIVGFERKVFILSNIQNNLAATAKKTGGFRVGVEAWEIINLAARLGARFHNPELHVVSRKPLFLGLDELQREASKLKGVKLGVHFVAEDRTQWHGEPSIWDGVFEKLFGSKA